MKEIVLTKTFKIEDQTDKSSLESQLYDSLYNALLEYNLRYARVKVEDIPLWLQNTPNHVNLESVLGTQARGFLQIHSTFSRKYVISCKNYFTLPTHFRRVKVLFDSEQNKFNFILFFNSQSLFFVNTIGTELLVCPLSNIHEIYQIDMTDKTVSVSQMSNLIPR